MVHGADMTFARPGAEIAVMGAEGAVNVLYAKQIKASASPEEDRQKYLDAYREKFYNP